MQISNSRSTTRSLHLKASYCCDGDLEARSHTIVQLDVLGMPRAGSGQQVMYEHGPLNTALAVTTND